jgi:predicted ABC-type exoprotein transport system permease subunit
MSQLNMFELLPFLASIYLELISPLSSLRMKKVLHATAKAEGLSDTIAEKIKAYAGYSSEASHIVSAFFLTIVAAIALPISRADISIGVPIVVTLLAVMLGFLYFVDILDPYRWATKVVKIGKRIEYSWASIIGMALNTLLILLLLFYK